MIIPKALLLPLSPRAIMPTILAMAVGAVIAHFKPAAFVVFGGITGRTQGRVVGVFEGIPVVVALVLTHGLTPRLPQWDGFGTVKTLRMAIAVAIVSPAVSCVYFLALLTLYPSSGDPPASVLRPVVNNVAVAALLAVVLLGVLGRLWGVMAWVGMMYAVLWAPTEWSWAGLWLPLNLSVGPTGAVDLRIHWWWLMALSTFALLTAWRRRLVPIGWAIRPAEERQ